MASRIMRTTAALVSAAVLLGGCAEGPPNPQASATSVHDSDRTEAAGRGDWDRRCAELGLTGSLLAIAGADGLNAQLHRVELCPARLARVTPYERFSQLGSNGALTVVTTGRHGVDRLELLKGGELVPVPGAGTPWAFSPAVREDGLLAYASISEETGNGRVLVLEPGARSPNVVHETPRPLTTLAWAGKDQLAVWAPAEGGEPGELFLVGLNGEARALGAGVTALGALAAGPRFLAFSSGVKFNEAGVLLDLTSGERRNVPADWKVRDWEPGGERLLVSEKDTGQLGLIHPDRPDQVEVIGTLPVGIVWSAVWLPGEDQ